MDMELNLPIPKVNSFDPLLEDVSISPPSSIMANDDDDNSNSFGRDGSGHNGNSHGNNSNSTNSNRSERKRRISTAMITCSSSSGSLAKRAIDNGLSIVVTTASNSKEEALPDISLAPVVIAANKPVVVTPTNDDSMITSIKAASRGAAAQDCNHHIIASPSGTSFNNNNNNNNNDGDEGVDDDDTFEISIAEEQKVVRAIANGTTRSVDLTDVAIRSPYKEEDQNNNTAMPTNPSSRQSISTNLSPSSSNTSSSSSNNNTSSNSTSIQPILLIVPPHTPLGIDIDMIMPLISYIQPSSPLKGHVKEGDILVFINGQSTAELSHGILTKMLNGSCRRSKKGVATKSGGGEGSRKLIFLPGLYRSKLGIEATATTTSSSVSGGSERRDKASSGENVSASDKSGEGKSSGNNIKQGEGTISVGGSSSGIKRKSSISSSSSSLEYNGEEKVGITKEAFHGSPTPSSSFTFPNSESRNNSSGANVEKSGAASDAMRRGDEKDIPMSPEQCSPGVVNPIASPINKCATVSNPTSAVVVVDEQQSLPVNTACFSPDFFTRPTDAIIRRRGIPNAKQESQNHDDNNSKEARRNIIFVGVPSTSSNTDNTVLSIQQAHVTEAAAAASIFHSTASAEEAHSPTNESASGSTPKRKGGVLEVPQHLGSTAVPSPTRQESSFSENNMPLEGLGKELDDGEEEANRIKRLRAGLLQPLIPNSDPCSQMTLTTLPSENPLSIASSSSRLVLRNSMLVESEEAVPPPPTTIAREIGVEDGLLVQPGTLLQPVLLPSPKNASSQANSSSTIPPARQQLSRQNSPKSRAVEASPVVAAPFATCTVSNNDHYSSRSSSRDNSKKSLVTTGTGFHTCKSMEQTFHTCQSSTTSGNSHRGSSNPSLAEGNHSQHEKSSSSSNGDGERGSRDQTRNKPSAVVVSSESATTSSSGTTSIDNPSQQGKRGTGNKRGEGDERFPSCQSSIISGKDSSSSSSSKPMTEQKSLSSRTHEEEEEVISGGDGNVNSSSSSSEPMTEQPSLLNPTDEAPLLHTNPVPARKDSDNNEEGTTTHPDAPAPSPSPPKVENDEIDQDEKRRLERRNRAPPAIDYVSIHGNNNNGGHTSHSNNNSEEEVSTIYGGKWNPALHGTCHRLEDTLGYIEEGYVHNSTSGSFDCGAVGIGGGMRQQQQQRGGRGYRCDPNTYSQLSFNYRCHNHHLLGLNNSNNSSGGQNGQEEDDCVEAQRTDGSQEDDKEEEEAKQRLRRQQQCVEGGLITLIVLSLVALVVILVLVLRR